MLRMTVQSRSEERDIQPSWAKKTCRPVGRLLKQGREAAGQMLPSAKNDDGKAPRDMVAGRRSEIASEREARSHVAWSERT